MDTVLESIHLALKEGASDKERASGAAACRALADLLARDGDAVLQNSAALSGPDAIAPPAAMVPTPTVGVPVVPMNIIGNPFSGMTPDQVLDLAIAKLRSMLGEAAPAEPAGPPFRVTLVAVPRAR